MKLILYITALQFWDILRDDKLKELSACLEKQKIAEQGISKDTISESESKENVSLPGTSENKEESENT